MKSKKDPGIAFGVPFFPTKPGNQGPAKWPMRIFEVEHVDRLTCVTSCGVWYPSDESYINTPTWMS